jgi:carbamoylphosphate synthase small subunit
MKNKKAYLVLADGTVFNGISMGKEGTALGEVVFNTCTASYGELLSDPTYYGQIVAHIIPLEEFITAPRPFSSNAPAISLADPPCAP